MNDIVILVGGKGSRLGKLTKKNPKPLIKIKNKRFLDIILSKKATDLCAFLFCFLQALHLIKFDP